VTPLESHLLALVCTNAYRAYCATLHGCTAPVTRELFDEAQDPKPGDLVIEISIIHYPERDEARFGRLLQVTREPIPDADPDYEVPPTERVQYIVLHDGRLYRWVNAGFVKVLEERSPFRRFTQ
jgi:hypothetical protein